MYLHAGRQNKHVAGEYMKIGSGGFESLISKKELVMALGVSGSFISKLMAEEGLPHFKIGRALRFRVSEVSCWLEHRRMA